MRRETLVANRAGNELGRRRGAALAAEEEEDDGDLSIDLRAVIKIQSGFRNWKIRSEERKERYLKLGLGKQFEPGKKLWERSLLMYLVAKALCLRVSYPEAGEDIDAITLRKRSHMRMYCLMRHFFMFWMWF